MGLEAGVITGSSARAQSRVHNPCYHELHDLSSIVIVLVFSELTSFVRMNLQVEENKGVELTVYPCNGLRAWTAKGRCEERGGVFFQRSLPARPKCVLPQRQRVRLNEWQGLACPVVCKRSRMGVCTPRRDPSWLLPKRLSTFPNSPMSRSSISRSRKTGRACKRR